MFAYRYQTPERKNNYKTTEFMTIGERLGEIYRAFHAILNGRHLKSTGNIMKGRWFKSLELIRGFGIFLQTIFRIPVKLLCLCFLLNNWHETKWSKKAIIVLGCARIARMICFDSLEWCSERTSSWEWKRFVVAATDFCEHIMASNKFSHAINERNIQYSLSGTL